MNKLTGFLVMTALLVLGVCGSAFATEVAVVNVDTLFAKSKPGVAAQKHLKDVQTTLQAGFDKLAAMHKGKENTPEAQQVLAQAEVTLNNQMGVESQAVDAVMADLLGKAVANWRKANSKYDIVVSNRLMLDFSDKVDVTAGVLKELDKLTPKFPELPKVTVHEPGAKK